jgi:Protein of unknown function (DUF4230)
MKLRGMQLRGIKLRRPKTDRSASPAALRRSPSGVPSSDWLKTARLMAMGGVAMLMVVAGVGVWRSGDRFFSTVGSLFQVPAGPTIQVDVRSVVIQQVRTASELTTAVFTMQAVVPTSQNATVGGFVVGKTKLLYIAQGEVQAGVDLSQLAAADVQVEAGTIRIKLPAPKVLNSKIDVTQSTVYDYDRGFLNLGPDAAAQLQSLAQQEALKQIIAAAYTQGLMKQANDRAKLVITQLLSTAGFKQVIVETQDAPTQPPAPTPSPSPIIAPLPSPTVP